MPCRVAVQQLGKQVIINSNSNSKPFPGHSPMSNDLFCLKECLDFFIHQKMQSVTVFEQNACRKWCPLSVEHKHYPWAWECRLWGWLETKSRQKVQKSKSLLDFSMFFPNNVASKMIETSIFGYFMMWSWSSLSIQQTVFLLQTLPCRCEEAWSSGQNETTSPTLSESAQRCRDSLANIEIP